MSCVGKRPARSAGRIDRWLPCLGAVLVAAACGCGRTTSDPAKPGTSASAQTSPGAPAVELSTLPDLSRTAEPVAGRIRERHQAATSLRETSPPSDRAQAYGELGKILLGARFYAEAERAFANARVLAPSDMRWPYYLGHLHKRNGALTLSLSSFEEARRLSPDHVATLVWLAEARLASGDVSAAEGLFARASALDVQSAAARFGRGRLALLRQEFKAAVEHLEAVLQLDPAAESAHYPLAMAYQGLGDQERARTHLALRRRGDIEVPPVDPLMQEVDALVESPVAFELRGIRALDRKDWATAVESFTRGVALAPGNASLRHRLGTALFMSGDATRAIEQFQEAIRVSPGYARAHYSLGVLLETSGRELEASGQYATAVDREPGYVEARSRLARVLRRTGRPQDALDHYAQVLAQDPRAAEAAFGYSLTLVRLGRYADARTRLTEDMGRFAERRPFALALVRILAAAPADGVRDAPRALALAKELLAGGQTVDLGEALAMALAESRDFAQAASIQRELLAAARSQGGRPDLIDRLTRNLRLYEQGRPCRQPWTEEPEFSDSVVR